MMSIKGEKSFLAIDVKSFRILWHMMLPHEVDVKHSDIRS